MIRVGLVGFGMAGRVFHAPLLSSVDGMELAAVMERANKAAERYPGIKMYRSLEEMLADSSLGLFVVATPNGTHFAIAREILSAGKKRRRRQANDHDLDRSRRAGRAGREAQCASRAIP